MRDEHDDRIHQALRHHLAGDIGRLVKSIGHAFDRLQARLYDAPWSRTEKASQSQCGKGFTAL